MSDEQVELTPELVALIDAQRAPLPERLSREGVARLLNISPAIVDHLTNIGVFIKIEDGEPAGQMPKIIGTRDAMKLIGMTDRSAFYKRVRLGFYRSFGPNNFNPEMIINDHEAYMRSVLPKGDYRRHAKNFD